MTRIRWGIAGIAAVAALAIGVGACGGGGEGADEARPSAGADADGALREAVVEEATAVEAAPAAAEPAAGDLAPEQGSALPGLPAIGPRVIQVAALTLAVPEGEFEETVERARTIAAGLGGFVTSASASQGAEDRLVRGTLVVRVPQRAYAQAMARLADLGEIQGREESGQDVSQQVVDLEARARHLEAVERQLLTFLEKTTTIADALVVQDRLNQVQLQLEEVRGQLRYLDDQTSFATITLNVAERGAPVAAGDDGGWGLADAWETAVRGIERIAGGLLVALVTAGPILAVLALAAVALRASLRRRREPPAPPRPADRPL